MAGVILLVVLIVAVTGFLLTRKSPTLPGPGPSSTPSVSATTSGTTNPGPVKAPMQGLVLERAAQLDDAAAGLVGGLVANASWADLQPTVDGPITDGNAIDQALAMASTFNTAHPTTPVAVKIRVLAGTAAPEWAKTLNGFQPVPVSNVQSGQAGTLGPFWTPAYTAAYSQLQAKLAARYDANPLIRDVTISQCMTVFAEPFQRDDTNFEQLFAQGYSVDADRACLSGQIAAHRVWRTTHQSLAFNPYRPWQDNGSGSLSQPLGSEVFPIAVMAQCRAVLGVLCTLENNSIRQQFITLPQQPSSSAKPMLAQYAAMYEAMRRLGPALTFQTAGPRAVGDLHATVAWAITLGANSVEIPQTYDPAAMSADNAALMANPTGPR